mgnify:CR=1 FL=1
MNWGPVSPAPSDSKGCAMILFTILGILVATVVLYLFVQLIVLVWPVLQWPIYLLIAIALVLGLFPLLAVLCVAVVIASGIRFVANRI